MLNRFINFFLLLLASLSTTAGINVKDFKAKGDGKTDDTYSIMRAMNKAFQEKEILIFPAGTYLVNYIDIKVSMEGVRGKTRIKNKKFNSTDIYTFCNINKQGSINIRNIIFDGSVEGSDTKPKFGAIPLFIYDCKNVKLTNCTFLNSPASGLRIELSNNIDVLGCNMGNLNGAFGDGVYIENCENVKIYDTRVNDYTRIGFVAEKNSRNILFNRCSAINGHDASILNGGTEFNAGFWAELTSDINILSCISKDNTHYGFVLTSGIDGKFLEKNRAANFSISNSNSYNNSVGFRVSSSGNAVDMKIENCKALTASQGFIAFSRDVKDIFKFINCTADLIEPLAGSVNDAGFMWESEVTSRGDYPVFIYKNCTTNYRGKIPLEKLYDRNTNNADLSTYSGGNAQIFIDNMKNNTSDGKPIIKAIKGNPKVEITNTAPDLRYMVRKDHVIIK